MQNNGVNLFTKDGAKLFVREWPNPKARSVFCIVHGLGEHSGRYNHMAEFLVGKGFAVISFDLRGHGRSEGKRGDAPSYEYLMDDISIFIEYVERKFETSKIFLYGHSLGGNLVINYALRRKPDVKAIIASAPAFRQAVDPSMVKLLFVKILYKILPAVTIKTGLDAHAISRQQEVVQAYMDDPLVHDKITPRFVLEFLDAGIWALDHARDFPLPLLVVHGEKDRITSVDASKEFAEKMGKSCQLKLWKECFHEIHNEPEMEELFKYLAAWIKKIK